MDLDKEKPWLQTELKELELQYFIMTQMKLLNYLACIIMQIFYLWARFVSSQEVEKVIELWYQQILKKVDTKKNQQTRLLNLQQ